LVETGDVQGARTYVKVVEARWPDDERVRHWARVLAPPRVIGTSPATGRRLDTEYAWLRDHAREHPGCWLLLRGDRLIAADPDVRVVREAGRKDGARHPLLWYQALEPADETFYFAGQ
jgi:hypothetical protein